MERVPAGEMGQRAMDTKGTFMSMARVAVLLYQPGGSTCTRPCLGGTSREAFVVQDDLLLHIYHGYPPFDPIHRIAARTSLPYPSSFSRFFCHRRRKNDHEQMPTKRQVLSDDTIPDLSKLPPASGPGRQRRVLLLSEKRSGGQAVGGILNADHGAFYVADPCRMGGGPEALDPGACSLAVLRLLACQPTINDVRNLFSFSYIVERVRERERQR